MLKRKIKRLCLLIIALSLLFCAGFFLAGGGKYYLETGEWPDLTGQSAQKLHRKAETYFPGLTAAADEYIFSDDNDSASATAAETADKEATENKQPAADKNTNFPSTWQRFSRIVFLKSAVAETISKENYVPLQDIPEALQEAVIAVEDRKFYHHWGFDWEGIMRASLVNLQYGQVREGASTITQQLVKNLFLSQEQTMGRKAEEFVLALDMEAHYSKEEILELYLNTIYFGSGYYGIREASQGYFGKEPAQLSLPEAAMLAGIPNAPSLYSPFEDFMLSKKRQITVLDAMVAAGYLRDSVAEDAKIKPLYLREQ